MLPSHSEIFRLNNLIVCYGGNPEAASVTWYNSDGQQL